MKRLCFLVVLALTVSAAYSQVGDKPRYQTGKLIDLRRESMGSGAARAQGSVCLTELDSCQRL